MEFLRVLRERLRHLVGHVERITFGSTRLLDLGDMEELTMAETYEDLANRLGTVREVVTRNLARFQNEGLIRMHCRDGVF